MLTHPPDRRAALIARHRADIVAAARALVTEHGAGGFSADDLAARADVARRTVFNHFASLDDVVVACLEEELASVIARVEDGVASAGPRSGPLEDLETSLRQADLPAAISGIGRMLTGPASATTGERVRQEALRRTADSMVVRLCDRYPDAVRLEVELLTTTVMHGVGVLAAEWSARFPQGPDAASRGAWVRLLDVLFARVRRGFEGTDEPPPARVTREPATDGRASTGGA